MLGELLLDGDGCSDDVVVVHCGAYVGREESPEGFYILRGFLCVSCVVGGVVEFLYNIGDDFFD